MAGQTRSLDLANVGAGWVDLTDMDHDRIAPGLAASNDKVYAFGGASKSDRISESKDLKKKNLNCYLT